MVGGGGRETFKNLEIRCYLYMETKIHNKAIKGPKRSGIELVSLDQCHPISA